MNLDLVEKIADAVLYEGYILYPYRASAVKNRQRFNWGVLAPQTYSEAQFGTERWQTQTEVLISGDENTKIDLKLRFLHLREREVYQVDEPTSELRPVGFLEVGGQIFQTWQEAVERETDVFNLDVKALAEQPQKFKFSFPANHEIEPLCDENQKTTGAIIRKQQSLEGEIEAQSSKLKAQSSKLKIRIQINRSRFQCNRV
ncbi:MAG: hypothetical protein WA584_20655 [Pyrinomonadaceae bacterium]